MHNVLVPQFVLACVNGGRASKCTSFKSTRKRKRRSISMNEAINVPYGRFARHSIVVPREVTVAAKGLRVCEMRRAPGEHRRSMFKQIAYLLGSERIFLIQRSCAAVPHQKRAQHPSPFVGNRQSNRRSSRGSCLPPPSNPVCNANVRFLTPSTGPT